METSRSIAVLGAGPIGLEAALHGRRLGYDVRVYERGAVGENLRQFGHVRLFSPWGMNCSPLGLSELRSPTPPAADVIPTAGEYVEQYLRPLANSPLLVGRIHERARVLSVARDGPLKGDLLADERRGRHPFRLLLRDADGTEREATADAVIDATGTFGNPNWFGPGGAPALGELALRCEIEHGLPDILGRQRDEYAGRHVLVVGAGYSAATNVIALATLAKSAPNTRAHWITRRPNEANNGGPLPRIPNDRLPERDSLARAANKLAQGIDGPVTHQAGCCVRSISIQTDEDQRKFEVKVAGALRVPSAEATQSFDRVIANVGFHPNSDIHRELQVHECYASGGPMKLAAALLGQTSPDCLDQTPAGPDSLRTPEANYYILGAKSYGRNSKFLISIGLEQVRDVYKLIAG